MKTITTLLLTLACFCAKAENIEQALTNAFDKVAETAFKAGCVTAYAYARMGLSTNSDAPASIGNGVLLSEEAWADSNKFQSNRKAAAVPRLFTNGIIYRSGFSISNIFATNGVMSYSTNDSRHVHLEMSGELVTNWVTTSIERPVILPSQQNDLVYRPDLWHETGIVKSNTVASFPWKDKTNSVVVESVELFRTNRVTVEFPRGINTP